MPPALPPRKVVTVADEALARRCAHGRVVLIDDHAEIVAALSNMLRLEGYACDEFASAVDYLAWRERAEPVFPGPVCILCDVRMPDMDGLELVRRLRDDDDTPLLLMSGASGIADAITAFRLGVVDFLLKPVELEEVIDAVQRALARSAQQQARRSQSRDLRDRFATLTPRERIVAERVAQGQTNQQIADALLISLRSAKRLRQSASEKLDAHTTAELVLKVSQLPSAGGPATDDVTAAPPGE